MALAKIAVIGYGYVGKAFVEMIRNHYTVCVYDPQYEARGSDGAVEFSSTLQTYDDCALGVVCVPTQSCDDGSCNISMVEEAIMKLETKLILIKSTIPPGTTNLFKRRTGKRIVFSPEYVGESTYYNPYFNSDMREIPFVIAGGDERDCNEIFDILLPILGPTKTYFKTASVNAEMIKYMENAYFATKITFVNEMYALCQAMRADWHSVREGWLLDPRVERMHTAVFPDKRGFRGKCLPKDIRALVRAAQNSGYNPEFLGKVIESNERFLTHNNDGGT